MTAPRIRTTCELGYYWTGTAGTFDPRTAPRQSWRILYDAHAELLRRDIELATRTPILASGSPLATGTTAVFAQAPGSPALTLFPKVPVTGAGIDSIALKGLSAGVQTENEPLDNAGATSESSGLLRPYDITATLGATKQLLGSAVDVEAVIGNALERACDRAEARLLFTAMATDSRVATASTAATTTGLDACLAAAVEQGMDLRQTYAVGSAQSYQTLANLQRGDGGPIVSHGCIDGVPLVLDASVPADLGAGSNQTCVFFIDPMRAVLRAWWLAYSMEDRYTEKKKGVVEYTRGRFCRPFVADAAAIVRWQFIVP